MTAKRLASSASVEIGEKRRQNGSRLKLSLFGRATRSFRVLCGARRFKAAPIIIRMRMKFQFMILIAVMACSTISQGQKPRGHAFIRIWDRQVIESDGMYNSTPAVARAENGDWVLSYRKGVDHVNSPLVILRRSHDHGQTWSPEVVYFNTSQPDPTLALTPDGTLLIEFVKLDPNGVAGAAYSLSQDSGLTWGPFQFFDDPASNTSAFPTAFMTVGRTMYGASYGPHGDGTDDAVLWNSEDSGLTWRKRSVIRQSGDAGINETTIAPVGTNRFLAVSRDDDSTNTWVHFSEDAGMTWGNQIDYTPQVGVLQLPQLIHAGRTLLLFGRQADPVIYPHEFVMFTSMDNGKTFANRRVLDTYTGEGIDGGYCWPILMDDGHIFVVYYADSNNLREPDIKSLVLGVGHEDSGDAR
jgi:hypothetical protein